MATTGIDTAHTELGEALTPIGLEYEGLLDYQRLNLKPDTRREVDEAIGDLSRRLQLMQTAQQALEALINDGYPALPVRAVSESVLEDLQAQEDSITAARAKFASNQASGISITAGEPQPKA